MEELNLLKKLERVKAPPDFEQKVMAQLFLRKKSRTQRLKIFRLSFASAFALLLVLFVFMNVFILQKKIPVELAGLRKGESSGLEREKGASLKEAIPITEAVDYSQEIRSLSLDPETIYILEQVSDIAYTEIKY